MGAKKLKMSFLTPRFARIFFYLTLDAIFINSSVPNTVECS